MRINIKTIFTPSEHNDQDDLILNTPLIQTSKGFVGERRCRWKVKNVVRWQKNGKKVGKKNGKKGRKKADHAVNWSIAWLDRNKRESGMPGLISHWVKLTPNGTNLERFKDQFQYILAPSAKMYWNLSLKSSRFVPFGARLAQCETISESKSLSQSVQYILAQWTNYHIRFILTVD